MNKYSWPINKKLPSTYGDYLRDNPGNLNPYTPLEWDQARREQQCYYVIRDEKLKGRSHYGW